MSNRQLRHLLRLLAEDKIAGEALQEIIESHESLVVSQITKKMLRQTRTYALKIENNHSRAIAFIRIFAVSRDLADLKKAYQCVISEAAFSQESEVYWQIKVFTKIYLAVENVDRCGHARILKEVCPEIPSSGHLLKRARELAEGLKEPYWEAHSWIKIFSATHFNEDLDRARRAVRSAAKNVGQRDSVLKSFALALVGCRLVPEGLKVAKSIQPYDYQAKAEALAAVARLLADRDRLKEARDAANMINNPNWLAVACAYIYAESEEARDLKRARDVKTKQFNALLEIYRSSRESEDLIRARDAALKSKASDRAQAFSKIASISHETVDFTEAERAITKIVGESSIYALEDRKFDAWMCLAEAMATRYLFT